MAQLCVLATVIACLSLLALPIFPKQKDDVARISLQARPAHSQQVFVNSWHLLCGYVHMAFCDSPSVVSLPLWKRLVLSSPRAAHRSRRALFVASSRCCCSFC